MGHFLVSAAHKSSGKTTISIGLCAALKNRGCVVQSFKKGPDYIDPMWLAKATGRDCYNLDFHTMEHEEILQTFTDHAGNAQISLIEGNKGLYDGLDLHGTNSNAALANLLKTPVILVIDAQGMTRGIAPMILGYQAFDPEINIAGIILNKLGGSRHESKLRAVIEHYTDVPVIGAVHRDPKLKILERHLGLIPSNELNDALRHVGQVANIIEQQVELEKLIDIADIASLPPGITPTPLNETNTTETTLKIGIAQDAAFGFYYPEDLNAFKHAGAELIPFDTLNDQKLPDVHGIFIGGGFPETHMEKLHANKPLRSAIRQAVENGLPLYAECGGLMYLTRSITWQDKTYEMVGALGADTVMHAKPQGRGYVYLRKSAAHLWNGGMNESQKYPAHEFHYSKLENIDSKLSFAYDVLRGTGVDGKHDGLIYKNTLACYAHLRHVNNNLWVQHFVDFIHQQQK